MHYSGPDLSENDSALTTGLLTLVQHEKYSELVARLIDDFQQRFEDFRKHTDIMKLLSDLFQVDPTGAAVNNNNNNRISIAPYGRNFRGANVKYQMEFADIQNDSDLKRAFSEQDLLSFDSGYVSSDSYPNLSQDAQNFTSLFGSAYCCNQLFSRMKTQNEIWISAYR